MNVFDQHYSGITLLKRKDKEQKCFFSTVLCFHCLMTHEQKTKDLKSLKRCNKCYAAISLGPHLKQEDIEEQIKIIQNELHVWSNCRVLNQSWIRKLNRRKRILDILLNKLENKCS